MSHQFILYYLQYLMSGKAKIQLIYERIYLQVHLFDVNIPGSTCFKESNAMSPGNTLNTFQMGKLKVGLGICHDMRFSEMAALYQKQGLTHYY